MPSKPASVALLFLACATSRRRLVLQRFSIIAPFQGFPLRRLSFHCRRGERKSDSDVGKGCLGSRPHPKQKLPRAQRQFLPSVLLINRLGTLALPANLRQLISYMLVPKVNHPILGIDE